MKNIFSRIIALSLTVLVALSSASCTYQTANADTLSASYKRNIAGNYTVSDTFTASANKFAMQLFSQSVSNNGNNVLISPLSAFCCLSLVANGANGNALTQIEQALTIDIEELNQSSYAFMNSIYSSKKCKLNIANSVWYNNSSDKLNVSPEFLQANANWYDSDIFAADFGEKTITDINNWCKNNTNGMIDSIISEIDPFTVMYLFNAIAFESEWAVQYKKNQINAGIFNNYNGTKANVQMMHSSENKYFEYGNAKGFAKNYSGDAYSFVGILPDEQTDIYEFAQNMNIQFWNNFLGSGTSCPVILKMPEFKFETDIINFDKALQGMGITDIFDSSKADFSKMGNSPLGNLYVSSVFQKAFIDVSRNGTKAAAITGADIKGESCAPIEEKYIVLDRPFIYAIIDNNTNIPLFIGITTSIQ